MHIVLISYLDYYCAHIKPRPQCSEKFGNLVGLHGNLYRVYSADLSESIDVHHVAQLQIGHSAMSGLSHSTNIIVCADAERDPG